MTVPFTPEPLYFALFYLRSALWVFAVSGLGLQVMGQAPRLSMLLKFSLIAGVFLSLIHIAPLGPAGQLTASFLFLTFALRQTRQFGLFVSSSAVILGLYLLVHAHWLLVQARLYLGLPLTDLSLDFLTALYQEAPALLLPAVLVCIIAFTQNRTRTPLPADHHYGSLFKAVDKDWRRRLIPVNQLLAVVIASYIISVYNPFRLPFPAETLVPFAISAVIVMSAFYREYRLHVEHRARYMLLEYVDLLLLAPFIHVALQFSGGVDSAFKLLYVPFVLANALKKKRIFGFLAFLFSSASLVSLATVLNIPGEAWNLESNLLYMGIYLFTFILARYYRREESKWQQVLKTKVYTDHVTGLYNYHYIRDFLDNRSDDDTDVLYLMVIDLDSLKAVNDRFGHPLGDSFLARVGQAIRQAVNPEDIAARYGSDEFIVLVKNQEEEKVLDLAVRIQEAVRREAVSFLQEHGADSLASRFTASIGISRSFNAPDGKTWLLTQADQNLREAQSSSKKRIVFRDIDDIPAADTVPLKESQGRS